MNYVYIYPLLRWLVMLFFRGQISAKKKQKKHNFPEVLWMEGSSQESLKIVFLFVFSRFLFGFPKIQDLSSQESLKMFFFFVCSRGFLGFSDKSLSKLLFVLFFGFLILFF